VFERNIELIEYRLHLLLLYKLIYLSPLTALLAAILCTLLIVRIHALLYLVLNLLLPLLDDLLPGSHILPLLDHCLEGLFQLLLLLLHEELPVALGFLRVDDFARRFLSLFVLFFLLLLFLLIEFLLDSFVASETFKGVQTLLDGVFCFTRGFGFLLLL
jgi:hypothetical protein